MGTKLTATLQFSISIGALALALPCGQAIAADGWGPSWSFNAIQPTSSNHLVYMRTTIVPGRLPSFSTGQLFIWPGISNPTSDLIQTTLDAYSNNGNASYCKAAAGQWCAEASVFGSFGQRNGTAVAVDGDDHITIEYKLESDNKTWTQTVSSKKLNKVISTLQSTSGLLLGGGMGFATEAQGDSYSIDNQYYLCTEARLAAADPNWGSTASGGTGARQGASGTASGPGTAKNIHTPDKGLTWLIDLITLPAMNPQGTQTPPPAYDCSGSGTTGTGGAGGGSGGSSGSGGATGKGGSTGSGGNAGSGGSSGSGGSARADGSAGSDGSARNDASSSSGGSVGSGGATAGTTGTSSGGAVGSGGKVGSGGSAAAGTSGGNGGAVGSGGSVAVGSGGASGTGGIKGTGGASQANQGSGGSVATGSGGSSGTAGAGGTTKAGSTGGSETASASSSGCNCRLGTRTSRGELSTSAFLLLGGLALLARRRRSHR